MNTSAYTHYSSLLYNFPTLSGHCGGTIFFFYVAHIIINFVYSDTL